MSGLNAWRINAILAGSPTVASDVRAVEDEYGESMCDTNHWYSNPFTMVGFAWANPKYHVMAIRLQEEINNSRDPIAYVDGVMYDYFGDTEEAYELYCEFIADVVNCIPAYRERWFAEMKEQLEHMGK